MGGEVVVTMGILGDDPLHIKDKVMAIMETNKAVSKFRGFSVWCAAYSIFFCVGTIIIYWDVNLGGAIMCVIPPLLVSSLLLLWVHHTYTVKLIKFYLINPPLSEQSKRDRIFNNIWCRAACTSSCPILLLIMLAVVHAKHWNGGDGNHLIDYVNGLLFIHFFVVSAHQSLINYYMDMHFHPFEEIKQQVQPPPPPPAAAISNSLNQTRQQQQEPPCLPNHQQKEETNNNEDLIIVGSSGSGPTAPPILCCSNCLTNEDHELFYRKEGVVDCREHERAADPIDNINHDKIVLGSNVSVPASAPILLSCDCSTSEELYRKEREDCREHQRPDLIDIIICHISDDEEKTSSS